MLKLHHFLYYTGKILPAHFQIIWSKLSRFRGSFQNLIFYIVCDVYINWSISWTITEKGSEVEKIVAAHFWLKWAIWRAHFGIPFVIYISILRIHEKQNNIQLKNQILQEKQKTISRIIYLFHEPWMIHEAVFQI